jgi:membrane complex biogenesis BtpA family protein
MAAAGRAIREAVTLPIGFNVLRNDARTALALCSACQGAFIRVNVHTGAMLTDQGIIEGNAFETVRYRVQIAPRARIFADVHVKHAVPLGPWTIADSARDAVERGSVDALIISGRGTGLKTDLEDVRQVRQVAPGTPVLIGSGTRSDQVAAYLELADGFIVGSSLKRADNIGNPVDSRRVAQLRRALDR